MKKLADSVCIRCGKQRIEGKKWAEILEKGSKITHSQAVCPDSECQKIVDSEFAKMRARREQLENQKTSVKI